MQFTAYYKAHISGLRISRENEGESVGKHNTLQIFRRDAGLEYYKKIPTTKTKPMIKKEAPIPIDANRNRDDKDTISPSKTFTIKYDGRVDIASAKSSASLNWKNRQVLLSDFLERLSQTHRTH